MSLLFKRFDALSGTQFESGVSANVDLHRLHELNPHRYPFLLQTVAAGFTGNRYDILFAFPGETLVLNKKALNKKELNKQSQLQSDVTSLELPRTHDFLDAFNQWWEQEKAEASHESELPFRGGWFVYLSYELAQQIEPRLPELSCDDGLPIAVATRIPAALIRDHKDNSIMAIAEPGNELQFEQLCGDLDGLRTQQPPETNDKISVLNVKEDQSEEYLDAVTKVKQYIRDGDVFQVNLSRQWQASLAADVDHNQLYHELRLNNPAPFFGLATYGDTAILSSSPERLVRVRDNKVETRPIAGTQPRNSVDGNDDQDREELIGHPKERAEHIMLIELERNDLGRVCKPGSVEVDELMNLESYAHVHHIVSNIRGELQSGIAPGDVIRAVFPGGTITGCPKVRCMEIIAELEQSGRGAYTGSMGYINLNGDMDLNILIRTIVKKHSQLFVRAGAGIVADSIPEKELAETRAKARGMLLALGIDSDFEQN